MTRGPRLTKRQKALIARWLEAEAAPQAQREFDNAFARLLEIDVLKEALENEADPEERWLIDKKIRGLDSKITPAAKAAAIRREPYFNATVLQYFRETKGSTNVARCIKYLDERGVGKTIQSEAKRARIKAVFGIVGRPGRPLGS